MQSGRVFGGDNMSDTVKIITGDYKDEVAKVLVVKRESVIVQLDSKLCVLMPKVNVEQIA